MKELLLLLIIILISTRCSGKIEKFSSNYKKTLSFCKPIYKKKNNRQLYNMNKEQLANNICNHEISELKYKSNEIEKCKSNFNKPETSLDQVKDYANAYCKIDDMNHSMNSSDYNWNNYCENVQSDENRCNKCLNYNGIKGKDWDSTRHNCNSCCLNKQFQNLRHYYDVGKSDHLLHQIFNEDILESSSFHNCYNLKELGYQIPQIQNNNLCYDNSVELTNYDCKKCVNKIPKKI